MQFLELILISNFLELLEFTLPTLHEQVKQLSSFKSFQTFLYVNFYIHVNISFLIHDLFKHLGVFETQNLR